MWPVTSCWPPGLMVMVLLPAVAHELGMFSGKVALSSTRPLQLLSLLSQISAEDCTLWLHFTAPPWQAVTPAEHTPCSPVLQATPPPGLPLSTTPLQSLSMLSQSSAVGCRFWLQATAPDWQTVVPAAQMPDLPV